MPDVAVRRGEALDLVACTSGATTSEALLGEVGAWLTEQGYTGEGFTEALVAREREHPTGVLTAGGGVALPHAEPELVTRPALVVCRPDSGVVFRRMDAPGREVEAEVVLVLVISAPERHMELLSGLAGVLGDGDRVRALSDAQADPEALLEIAVEQLAATLPRAP